MLNILLDQNLVFYLLTALLVVSASMVVICSSGIMAIMSLMLAAISLSIINIAIGSEFIGLAIILVYIGAVMLLFVFVTMMLGADKIHTINRAISHSKNKKAVKLAMFLGFILHFSFLAGQIKRMSIYNQSWSNIPFYIINHSDISILLYGQYAKHLIGLAMLILLAIIGCIAIAKKDGSNITHKKLSPYQQIERNKSNSIRLIPNIKHQKQNTIDGLVE